jgi:hypothetical protein
LNSWARYSRTRGTINGCESAATICASPRTRARAFAPLGSSGGCGYTSSIYSMIASDSNSAGPSPSIKAGSDIIGLTSRYFGSR